MAAAPADFSAEHATLFHWRIELKESETGPSWDLTGAEPRMEVRTAHCDDPPILVFDQNGGGIINFAPSQGIFELHKTSSEMSDIAAGSYVYDLILIRTNEVQRVLTGAFVVTSVVTQVPVAPAGRRTQVDMALQGDAA